MSSRPLVIAIDGPSGAGKGTVSRTLAARLAYRHLDTGAMYRAIAWKAIAEGLDLGDPDALAALAHRATIDMGTGVHVDGHDVTQAIRTPEIDRAAGIVAQYPAVRSVLVAQQRQFGAGGGVVMEGRDIGSVVFPSADLKVYLDASPDERARRRSHDAAHAASQGTAECLRGVAEALAERDRTDRTRSISPLTVPPGAIYIDTTGLAVADVVERVFALVEATQST